jgi:ParB family chromosome partitioning protein
MATKRRPVTKTGRPRKRKGVKLEPTNLEASQTGAEPPPELAAQVERDGGKVLAAYKEPLGGHVQLLVALPIDKVQPTPFQRDVSDAHVRKLTLAMDKTRRYLDPIIAVHAPQSGHYETPNGNHRLTAMRELGAKTILALLVPEREVAYQILALNIEKAHNLRERALEVARMYEDLKKSDRKESDFALEFEEASLCTLGFAYRERGRLSGGAYHPALRKVDGFFELPLKDAWEKREARAQKVLALDEAVTGAVQRLKERGFNSPYLRAFVVARVNPLRFIKGELPSFDELMATMTKRAGGMDAGKIKTEDLARSGGAPDEGD